nr:MAG TPA: hypothetical protein [Caudoviricetes sp.]
MQKSLLQIQDQHHFFQMHYLKTLYQVLLITLYNLHSNLNHDN